MRGLFPVDKCFDFCLDGSDSCSQLFLVWGTESLGVGFLYVLRLILGSPERGGFYSSCLGIGSKIVIMVECSV